MLKRIIATAAATLVSGSVLVAVQPAQAAEPTPLPETIQNLISKDQLTTWETQQLVAELDSYFFAQEGTTTYSSQTKSPKGKTVSRTSDTWWITAEQNVKTKSGSLYFIRQGTTYVKFSGDARLRQLLDVPRAVPVLWERCVGCGLARPIISGPDDNDKGTFRRTMRGSTTSIAVTSPNYKLSLSAAPSTGKYTLKVESQQTDGTRHLVSVRSTKTPVTGIDVTLPSETEIVSYGDVLQAERLLESTEILKKERPWKHSRGRLPTAKELTAHAGQSWVVDKAFSFSTQDNSDFCVDSREDLPVKDWPSECRTKYFDQQARVDVAQAPDAEGRWLVTVTNLAAEPLYGQAVWQFFYKPGVRGGGFCSTTW